MVRKVAGIVLLVLIIGGIIGYITLGGLREPVIAIQPIQGYTIIGADFKGSASDEKLTALFEQVREYNRAGTLPGTLTSIYYDTLNSEKGHIKCLVGVIVQDIPTTLPATFYIKKIQAKQVIQAQVQSHFLVAPAPGKIQESLTAYAGDRGLQLENFLIEKYIDESNFILEIPIKTN